MRQDVAGRRDLSGKLDRSASRCYQLMEAESADALAPWIAAWNDIVDFEVVPVLASADYWAMATH
jgi:hypothetical protein